jgi:hypothetical protein
MPVLLKKMYDRLDHMIRRTHTLLQAKRASARSVSGSPLIGDHNHSFDG